MFFTQYYLGCLAHASYMIGSKGNAVVVDPQRDIDQYVNDAKENGLTITHILETHTHADFVSGHLELAEKTGAKIVLSEKAKPEYAHQAVADGDVLTVGDLEIQCLETPGHTPESITYIVRDTADASQAPMALTGDTLFFGEVGRPDLAGSRGYTARQMAEMLYDSLTNKIKTLAPETMVYPAHGAGSLCGRKIADKSSSTIGEELKTNYALQPMDRETFIATVTENQPEIPPYFPRAVELNKSNLPALADIPRPDNLVADRFAEASKEANAVVVDVRENEMYAAGHIPGSISIPLQGQFAQWAGMFIAPEQKILLVTNDENEVDEATMRLARVGLHNAAGYLANGIFGWNKAGYETAALPNVFPTEVSSAAAGAYRIVDVRRAGELESGVIENAIHMPLDQIPARADELAGDDTPVLVVCRSGNRSAIGCSLLERAGIAGVTNLSGGMNGWEAACLPTVQPQATA